MNQIINVFDLEMVCDETRVRGEIIAFGAVKMDLITGEILKTGKWLIRPKKNVIPQYCTDLLGIDAAMLSKRSTLQRSLTMIDEEFGLRGIRSACWGDDAEYLWNACKRQNFNSPLLNNLNIQMMYDTVRMKPIHKRTSLKAALQYENLQPQGDAHCPVSDSINAANILFNLIKNPTKQAA